MHTSAYNTSVLSVMHTIVRIALISAYNTIMNSGIYTTLNSANAIITTFISVTRVITTISDINTNTSDISEYTASQCLYHC